MSSITLLLAAFAPGVFWLWLFYKKDKLEPEPKRLIVLTFLLGMGLGIPATLLELFFTGSPLSIVLLAPIIEEGLKYSGVRLTVYRNAEFNEPLDGIIYTAALALGFASMENWLYLLAAYLNAPDVAQSMETLSPFGVVASVFVVRAFLSVPSHVLYSSMWGSALGRAKFADPARGNAMIQQGFLLAILCHGLFNLFASHFPEGIVPELVLMVVMWVIVLRSIRECQKGSPHRSL